MYKEPEREIEVNNEDWTEAELCLRMNMFYREVERISIGASGSYNTERLQSCERLFEEYAITYGELRGE